MPESIEQRAAQWVVGPDTGISSLAIWATMMGVAPSKAAPPYDVFDFGRCYRLLALIPEWKSRLPEMEKYGSLWPSIVRDWDGESARYLEALAHGRIHVPL